MNSELHSTLASIGARFESEGGYVSDFGDPPGELQAATSGVVSADLSHFTLLSISGADATAFLQGQFSCDVAGLNEGRATYGSYCSPKGRMLATFLLWQELAGWRLLISTAVAAAFQKRLRMFVLRTKVLIEDLSPETALIGIAGASASESLADLGLQLPVAALSLQNVNDGEASNSGHTSVIAIPGNRWIVCVTVDRAKSLWPVLASRTRTVGTTVWDWTDIRNGIPHLVPATQEQFVPQMANLEVIGGVSFKKGCYPGQEIVARTQYLGKTKRRMYLAHGTDAAVPGAPVFSDDVAGQANGMVVNSAKAPGGGFDMLVVVQSDSATQSRVHAGAPTGPVLEFAPLPYTLP